MPGTLAPTARQQFFDNDGDPVAGGRLYTYASGTTTPAAIYTTSALDVPHPNPAILDSAGRLTLYLDNASYRFSLHDSADVHVWTVDPVQAVAPYSVDLDIDGVAGEALAAGQVVFISDGSGGRTAGRWYLTDADATATSTAATMVGMTPALVAQGATGTIRLQGRLTGLSALSAGATYYVSATAGALTSVAPVNARLVGVADSTTSLILYGAAVGNQISVSGIGFTPLASTGSSGAVVATINASTEGLRISGALIEINGTVTFASGYDPSAKVATGGAAADINSGITTISGAKITTGSLSAAQIGAGTITGDRLVAGTITATQIAAGTITGDKIAATTLTGVTINGGTINAGTAGTVKLSASGMQIDATTSGTVDLTKAISWKTLALSGSSSLFAWENTVRRRVVVQNITTSAHVPSISLEAAGGGVGKQTYVTLDGGSATTNPQLSFDLLGEIVCGATGDTPTRMRPGTSGTMDLGSQAYKFKNIYLTLPYGGTHYVLTDSTGALFFGSAI